ncbi:unnamed protein product [Plasmodium vivax]|uniref:(malaria parasite P. vivax) hypothetical protein n=1 Tax=Plasmodium vivax TaxID=5855 RepID=A0A8S4H884_PLAVI|nr:unnamed protein product [Plasmodium vivax]
MKNQTDQFKQSARECIKLSHKSSYYSNKCLYLNGNWVYAEEGKEIKKYNSNFISKKNFLSYLHNLRSNVTYINILIKIFELIYIYYFFILQFVAVMAQDTQPEAGMGAEASVGTEGSIDPQVVTDPQGAIAKKLSALCSQYIQVQTICESNELMGMLGFFIFSTVISLIFGIFRRCIFRCKTCCIYGTRSSRRKRMEEERQENEMFEQQMSSLQMRKNLLTRQQKSLQALMQGSQGNDKKKKKKSSKKETENWTNVFGVGYMPVSQ